MRAMKRYSSRTFAGVVAGLVWLGLAAGCGQAGAPPIPATATPAPRATPTQTPTLTPTPTFVPTYPPLPTWTPTVRPEVRLEVIGYTTFRAGGSLLYAAGAAVNRGNAPAGEVHVAVSLLSASGKVAAKGSLNESNMWYVPPGGKYPFLVVLPTAPQQWKDVKVEFDAQLYSPEQLHKPYWNLKVDKVAGQAPQGAYPNFRYSGRVTNTGPQRARMVQVIAITYDAGGKVLDVSSAYVEFEYLNPGQDAPFQLMFKNIKSAPARYEILAEGYLTE